MSNYFSKAGKVPLAYIICVTCVSFVAGCGGGEDAQGSAQTQSNLEYPNSSNLAFEAKGLYDRNEVAFAQSITGTAVSLGGSVPINSGDSSNRKKTTIFSVSNFDNPAEKLSNWKFIIGAEYPGARGTLSEIISDLNGTVASRLSYDLGCNTASITAKTSDPCGKYVGMALQLSQPIDFSPDESLSLSFKYKDTQSMVNPIIRITDATGQTFQYKTTNRTLETQNHDDWQTAVVNLKNFVNHFGGVNDGVIRSPIKGIFIGVGNFSLQMPAGWIDIDDIEIIKNRSQVYELDDHKPVAVPSDFPTYVGRLAASTYTSLELAHKKAKDVGITIIRRSMQWNSVEKNGAYDFTEFDQIADTLQARGMSVLWIIQGGHVNHGGKAPIAPEDQDAFARFAYAAAAHFKNKNVVGFEIWNEPNTFQFWPSPNPYKYASLLNKAAAAIKAADPHAKTISGGTAGVDMTYSLQLASQINFNNLDAVGVHPYTRENPESYAAGCAPLSKINSLKYPSRKIWNTESGFPSYGYFDSKVFGDGLSLSARNRQAILNLRTVLTQLAVNTPLITLTSLTDYGEDPLSKEANFGLMNHLGWDKPSMYAMRMLIASQYGRTFKGAMGDLPAGLHAVKWEGETDSVFAIWSDDPRAGSYILKVPPSANRVKRWSGLGIVGVNKGAYTEIALSEQDGPVFVRLMK
ncbi:MAG: cellulase family glycosylhydrolase [Acidobacteriota bacterium]